MATLTERLQLVVDATTDAAETRFQRLSGVARETGTTATRTASDVAAAADRMAAAQLKQADASKAVQVAQLRLDELRQRGNASASQLAAAEGKVESAQRRLHVATRELTRSTQDQGLSMERAGASAERGARGINVMATAQRALVAGGALMFGGALLDRLRELPGQFAENAKAAGQLGTSMNATTEQAGAFLGLVGTLGLDLNDLLEIQAEFAQKVSATNSPLAALGGQLDRNADGTVNWANTLVDFLERLQGVDDATERNRLGFQALGEEGYKQLSQLVNSGVSVRDALAQIGTPFSDEDIALAAEYTAAMREFDLTTGELERTLGRALLPALTGAAGALDDVASAVMAIPAPIGLATVAALALGRDAFGVVSKSGAAVTAVTDGMSRALDNYRLTMAISGDHTAAVSGAMATAWGGARRGLGGLVSLAGGPLGIALIGAGVAASKMADGTERLESRAHDAAVELSKLEGSADKVAIATRTQANELEESASYFERSAAYVRGYQEDLDGVELAAAKLIAPFQRLTMGFGDTADTAQGFELAIEDAKKELGAFGAQQAVAQVTTKGLSDLIAEGTTSGKEFGAAVTEAAKAQADQATTSGLAEAAVAAYNATTRDAAQTALGLMDATLGAANAQYSFLSAMDDAKAATDDGKTSLNEVDQAYTRLQEAALGSAQAAADAAVEQARSSGVVLDAATEASTRADAMLADLRGKLDTPGLTDRARADLQGMVDKLQEAKDNGDVQAQLTLTGVPEAAAELDSTTEDRTAPITVESRGGPAVISYLDSIIGKDRLAVIRVESRNGPAVQEYLEGLRAQDRLALIRVESRGGPAVAAYLDGIAAKDRLAIIRVETRGGPAAAAYLDDLAGRARSAVIQAPTAGAMMAAAPPPAIGPAVAGAVHVAQLTVQVVGDGAGRVSQASLADAGRQVAASLDAHARTNGFSWRNPRGS